MNNTVYSCSIYELPKIHNRAGNITVLENNKNIPFDIKRIFFLYDIPGGEDRGGHAHKKLHQFMIAVSGSFDVLIDDGKNKKIVRLDRPYFGLHIIPGIWNQLLNFSSGAVCLVLASDYFITEDYIKDYQIFLMQKNEG
jgi:hypothetical protein